MAVKVEGRKGTGVGVESSGVFGVYVTTTNGNTYGADQVESTILLLSNDQALELMAELAIAIAETELNREAKGLA